MQHEPLDTDIRVWLSSSTYLRLKRRAREDDRPISVYVRRLIERDLKACSQRDAYQFAHRPKPKPKPKKTSKTPDARRAACYRIKDPVLALALSGVWGGEA